MHPDGHEERGGRRGACVALAVLVLVGAWLRLSGIGYLLPEVMNRDGLVFVRQVEILRGGPATAVGDATRYSFYPLLIGRIAELLPQEKIPEGAPADLARHLEVASSIWIRLREISVALSLLAIPATYLLARRFLDRLSSLFAAALVATSLHHIVLSIQEKPHAAATSFIALALLAALRLRRKPDALAYVACGIAGGLAIGTLQNAAVCLLPIAAAFFLAQDGGRRASRTWVLATLALLAVAVRCLYPFYFEGLPGSIPASGEGVGLSAFVRKLASRLGGAPCARILSAVWGLDPLLVTAAGAGVLVWLLSSSRKRDALRGDLAVLLALVVPYLAVLALYRETLVRFCLPFVPLLACAAAYAFRRARDRWRIGAAGSAALALALLAVPLWPAVHFANIRREPGPMEEASRWIEAHAAPSDTVIVVPEYDLALLPTDDAIRENAHPSYRTIWTEYLAHVPPASLAGPRRRILIEPGERPESRLAFAKDPIAYAQRYGARWMVVDLSGLPRGALKAPAVLEERISPIEKDADAAEREGPRGRDRGVVLWGTGYDPLRPSAASILRSRSLGTAVEIYRVP
jgi:hypothetical protein